MDATPAEITSDSRGQIPGRIVCWSGNQRSDCSERQRDRTSASTPSRMRCSPNSNAYSGRRRTRRHPRRPAPPRRRRVEIRIEDLLEKRLVCQPPLIVGLAGALLPSATSTDRRAAPWTCSRTRMSTESISTSVSRSHPPPEARGRTWRSRSARAAAGSSWLPAASTGADDTAPSYRARSALTRPSIPALHPGFRHLAQHRVQHDVDELRLAGHVGVEGHRADPQPVGDAPHG